MNGCMRGQTGFIDGLTIKQMNVDIISPLKRNISSKQEYVSPIKTRIPLL